MHRLAKILDGINSFYINKNDKIMKRRKKLYCLTLIALFAFSSCMKPRVELNDTVWGDQAYITAAVMFRHDEVKNQLGYNEVVTGYLEPTIATTSNVVDKGQATIRIVTVKGTDLTKIGIRFTTFGTKIEPLNGAPVAGVISDFSKGQFAYRVYSADGTVRDWTILVSVSP
jgi:hypothetical protein